MVVIGDIVRKAHDCIGIKFVLFLKTKEFFTKNLTKESISLPMV